MYTPSKCDNYRQPTKLWEAVADPGLGGGEGTMPPGPIKISHKQECIPVGCVPSAAVAV